MKRRALVTGAAGFVGKYLCEHLVSCGWEVRRTDLSANPGNTDYYRCDICDREQLQVLFEWAGDCTHVFHLAALTFVPDSIRNPQLAVNVNLGGTIAVAEAMQQCVPEARLLYIASAEVYGPPVTLPITEDHPLNPANPYAIAKAAADHYCAFLHKSHALDVVRVRPFNHSGPGQIDSFVLSAFAHQIARMESGAVPPVLHVGNLAARRDFSHVSDVVRAYERIAEAGEAGEAYNVCSGQARAIQDAVDGFLELANTEIEVRVDPERLRAVDVAEFRGSHAKVSADTGWQPQLSFDDLMASLLDYWRGKE